MLMFVRWVRAHWPQAGGMVLAIAVAGWWGFCRPRPNVVPAPEQRTLDSLGATAPLFHAQQLELAKRETVYVARATRAAGEATTARHAADSLSVLADTLAARAAADTMTAWHRVADVWRQVADSLRVANDSLMAATHALDTALAASDARSTVATARLAAVTDVNARLANDVRKAGDCRVLPFVSCPSRRASFIVGGVLGTVGTVWLVRRK